MFFITGGQGKISRRLSKLLHDSGVPFFVGSRTKSERYDWLSFDWFDDSTWDAVFERKPNSIFIIGPTSNLMAGVPQVNKFIDRALAVGTHRFVLLSASLLKRGTPPMGVIHQHLHDTVTPDKGSYFVLRPTFFMTAFSEQPRHLHSIRTEDAVFSATGEGRIPWISPDDIAAVVFAALVTRNDLRGETFVDGADSLTYDEVAEYLSKGIGRRIRHERVSVEEVRRRYIEHQHVEPNYATILANNDLKVAQGAEERSSCIEPIIGRPPTRFETYVKETKDAWLM